MPLNIEILSVGGWFGDYIAEAAQVLNGVQSEFRFVLPPERLRSFGLNHIKDEYHTEDVVKFLETYREHAKGDRRYLIAVIDAPLRSNRYSNLFGYHEAERGLAVVTLDDHKHFVESTRLYLCYYFIRYALSFVCPSLKCHRDTRGCFFDFKEHKIDIQKSLDSGNLCPECRTVLWNSFNEEIVVAIRSMTTVMKALRAGSQADLQAGSLKGQVDIGIITVREDEFEAVLERLPWHRHVRGSGSDYTYSRVQSVTDEEWRIAVARSPEQGQSAAQAIASCMITDLSPNWIFLVGIAGGFPAAEYTLGDVLLSQRMHDFSVTAAIEGKNPEFQDMGGPMALEVEKLVASLKSRRAKLGPWSTRESLGREKPAEKVPKTITSQKLYGDAAWRKDTLKSLKSHFPEDIQPSDPDFSAAVMIAGNTLLKDTKLAKLWRKTARHASGVEMELGGVCRAARHLGDGQTRVLAIRGVSDIVGYKRSPLWTKYACQSAAAFAHALIVSGVIPSEA